jgi:hypothetical protein
MRALTGLALRLISIAVIIAALVGCVRGPSQMRLVADRIRAAESPFVDAVVYDPGDWLDEPYVAVFLRPGTSTEEAASFWCEVVVPAGGTGQSDESRMVSVWEAGTDDLLLSRDGVPCP